MAAILAEAAAGRIERHSRQDGQASPSKNGTSWDLSGDRHARRRVTPLPSFEIRPSLDPADAFGNAVIGESEETGNFGKYL
jgi:hypothetical protein